MTDQKVIARLESDPLYSVAFVADNNPSGLVSSLANNGISMPSTVPLSDIGIWAYKTIVTLLSVNKPLAIKVISETQYNKGDDAATYTQGYINYFSNKQPAQTVTPEGKFSLDALFGGLGAGLQTYAGVSLANEGQGSNLYAGSNLTQAQHDAELKAAETRKMWWIIGGSVIGLLLLAAILYFAFKKDDDKKPG